MTERGMHYCFLTTATWEQNASFVRLREFGEQMLKRGVRVSYIVDDLPFNRTTLELPAGAQISFVPAGELMSQTFARRRILRELSPDFVHVLNPYIKAFLALALSGHNVVGDWDEWPAHRDYSIARVAMERFLDRWLRRRSKVVVVASKYLQGKFAQLGRPDAVYIPYATYLQSEDDATSPFTEPTAVYVGNLFPAYDHDLLFDAATILKNIGRQPRIMMLGRGPDLDKWRVFVRERGLDQSISLPGFMSGADLWRHLRHAHVLLLPIRETLLNLCRCPSKTYAYAQSRRPIIANRVGEVAQVLNDKAIYVDAKPEAFADAIDRVMSAPRADDVDYAVEQHNWAARTDALLAAVEQAR